MFGANTGLDRNCYNTFSVHKKNGDASFESEQCNFQVDLIEEKKNDNYLSG